ncbi:MAG: glycosyltransferase, partial [Fimbriiglobus sp.]
MRVTYFYNWGVPHPVRYGADTVAANHLEYFKSRGWAVHVVTPRVPGKDEAAFRAAVPWLDGLTVVDLPPAPATFREQLEMYVTAARDPRVIAAFDRPADVLFTNYVYTAPLARLRPPGCRAVVETHDVMAEQSRIQAIVDRPPGVAAPPLLDRGRDFLRRVELDLYGMFDAVIMISRDELADVGWFGATNAHYVPQFAAKTAACGTAPDAPFDLLFVGSDVAPNVAGLRWFYRSVFVPHLWHRGV